MQESQRVAELEIIYKRANGVIMKIRINILNSMLEDVSVSIGSRVNRTTHNVNNDM